MTKTNINIFLLSTIFFANSMEYYGSDSTESDSQQESSAYESSELSSCSPECRPISTSADSYFATKKPPLSQKMCPISRFTCLVIDGEFKKAFELAQTLNANAESGLLSKAISWSQNYHGNLHNLIANLAQRSNDRSFTIGLQQALFKCAENPDYIHAFRHLCDCNRFEQTKDQEKRENCLEILMQWSEQPYPELDGITQHFLQNEYCSQDNKNRCLHVLQRKENTEKYAGLIKLLKEYGAQSPEEAELSQEVDSQ